MVKCEKVYEYTNGPWHGRIGLEGPGVVTRETYSAYRGRPLVIELRSTYVRIRPKGRRRWYECSYDALFSLGAKIAAQMEREAKAKERKGRKPARQDGVEYPTFAEWSVRR